MKHCFKELEVENLIDIRQLHFSYILFSRLFSFFLRYLVVKGLYTSNIVYSWGSLMSQITSEAIARRSSVKNMFLKMSQNSQENTCVGVSFFMVSLCKVAGLRLRHSCFLLNFAKFLRTHFFIEHLRWLLPILEETVFLELIEIKTK